jgi:N-methylhydantoinase B
VRNLGTPQQVELGRIDMVTLDEGETVTFLTPGGGGYGDPFLRPPEAVLEDVLSGWVSAEAAARAYGVAIAARQVEAAETARLRAARPLRTAETHSFDVGPERAAWDAVFTPARMAALNAEVFRAPPGARTARRRALFAAAVPALVDPAARASGLLLPDSEAAAAALDAALLSGG